jgi:hypothetical protein
MNRCQVEWLLAGKENDHAYIMTGGNRHYPTRCEKSPVLGAVASRWRRTQPHRRI